MFTVEEARDYVEANREWIDGETSRQIQQCQVADTPHVRAVFAAGIWFGAKMMELGYCIRCRNANGFHHGQRCQAVPDIDPFLLAVSQANQLATAKGPCCKHSPSRFQPSPN